MAPALILALALMATDPATATTAPSDGPPAAPAEAQSATPPDADPIGAIAANAAGEPLPAGAPTNDYQLTGWCYGALGEYLDIYDRVKPDLRAIDKLFGTSNPDEAEPYHDDIVAARHELKIFAGAVEAAEKASPMPIATQGVEAIKLGRSIWRPAEAKTRRELARAWLSWGLPDRCDATARALAARANLLGKALTYNAGTASDTAAQPATPDAPLVLKPIDQGATAPDVAPGPSPRDAAGAQSPPSSPPPSP